jgi:hypothetical protein
MRKSRHFGEMDDLLDLRARIQQAVERRDQERPGSAGWQAADAEIEALTRRVWEAHEPPEESSREAR